MKSLLPIIGVAVVLAAAGTQAETVHQFQSAPGLIAPSSNKLRMHVVMHFPFSVATVQEGAEYLMEPAGYQLASLVGPDTRQILLRPLLPHVKDRSLLAIEDALLLISGDDTRLVVDHANKLVTLEKM